MLALAIHLSIETRKPVPARELPSRPVLGPVEAKHRSYLLIPPARLFALSAPFSVLISGGRRWCYDHAMLHRQDC